jgi:hypothetical protein
MRLCYLQDLDFSAEELEKMIDCEHFMTRSSYVVTVVRSLGVHQTGQIDLLSK